MDNVVNIHKLNYQKARENYQKLFLDSYDDLFREFGPLVKTIRDITEKAFLEDDISKLKYEGYHVFRLISDHGPFEESESGQAVTNLTYQATLLVESNQK